MEIPNEYREVVLKELDNPVLEGTLGFASDAFNAARVIFYLKTMRRHDNPERQLLDYAEKLVREHARKMIEEALSLYNVRIVKNDNSPQREINREATSVSGSNVQQPGSVGTKVEGQPDQPANVSTAAEGSNLPK